MRKYPPLYAHTMRPRGKSAPNASIQIFPQMKIFCFGTADMENYHKKYQNFYNSAAWKALRAQKFAQENGLCERCRKKGRIIAGKEVHHKIPIESRWDLRLDIDNLELLCPACHNGTHGRESALQDFKKFWEELTNGESAENGHG